MIEIGSITFEHAARFLPLTESFLVKIVNFQYV